VGVGVVSQGVSPHSAVVTANIARTLVLAWKYLQGKEQSTSHLAADEIEPLQEKLDGLLGTWTNAASAQLARREHHVQQALAVIESIMLRLVSMQSHVLETPRCVRAAIIWACRRHARAWTAVVLPLSQGMHVSSIGIADMKRLKHTRGMHETHGA
jgi:hypothetical protein